MKTTNIVDSNVDKFASILNLDEVIGIEAGRFSALGVYNEKTGEAQGVLVAEIYEEFMEIKSVLVEEKSRNKGVAKKLLEIALDMPEDVSLPVYTTNSENIDFLQKNGFVEQESKYYYVRGTLEDLIDISKPKNIRKGTELTTLEALTDRELKEFIMGEHTDGFIQFPEKVPVIDRFSAGSIACRVDGKLEALILIEELSDCLRITYYHGKDIESLYLCFSVLKNVLENDYEGDVRIKFLACEKNEEEKIRKMINNGQSEKIRIFKYMKQIPLIEKLQ